MSTPKTTRGGKYKGNAPKPAPQPKQGNSSGLIKTKDSKGKEHYTEPKYGIRVSHSMIKALGEAGAAQEAKNVTDVFDAIGLNAGEAKEALKRIDADRMSSNTYANYSSGDREINANPSWFKNPQKMIRQYQSDVKAGYHVKGTTAADLLSHEAGHAIGYQLGRDLYKIYQAEHGNNFGIAWSYIAGGQAEKDIVHQALQTLKRSTKQSFSQMINGLSRYAAKNRKECFAEAMADYRANGKNSNPLTLEIVKITKQTLKDIRKKKKKYGI